MMFGPDATAMNCRSSNTYVIGDAFQIWLVWKLQSTFPVRASAAASAPLSSANTTTSPAVLRSLGLQEKISRLQRK